MSPGTLPAGTPKPPAAPPPKVPAKAMELQSPPAKASAPGSTMPSRPAPKSEQGKALDKTQPPAKEPLASAPVANAPKADPPKASEPKRRQQQPPEIAWRRPVRDQEPSEWAAFGIKECEDNNRAEIHVPWLKRMLDLWSRNFSPSHVKNGYSCFSHDIPDDWHPQKRRRSEFKPRPNEVGGMIPTNISRSQLAGKMVNNLNHLREFNNVNVSVLAHCVVYDRIKKENVDYEATMDHVERTISFINAHPALRRETRPIDLEMIELPASGQIMRTQGILTRHCGKREEDPVVEKRTINYFHADSMSCDLLVLLNESYDLRLRVGTDLLPLISMVLTNPTHRFQFAIPSGQQWREWKANGVPQNAWFSRLEHMPMLPTVDNAGAVLVRAGRGQSSGIMSMEGLNRQFRPGPCWYRPQMR